MENKGKIKDNNVKEKINTRFGILNNTLHKHKQEDTKTKTALESIPNRFAEMSIDKATGNVALICRHFYTSAIAKEAGIGYSEDFSSKFSIDDIDMDNRCLSNMYCRSKIHKAPIKATTIHKILQTNSSFHVK